MRMASKKKQLCIMMVMVLKHRGHFCVDCHTFLLTLYASSVSAWHDMFNTNRSVRAQELFSPAVPAVVCRYLNRTNCTDAGRSEKGQVGERS